MAEGRRRNRVLADARGCRRCNAGASTQRFLKIYLRMLGFLGPHWRAAAELCTANVALVGIGFVEPVLFGHVIGSLAGAGQGYRMSSPELRLLVAVKPIFTCRKAAPRALQQSW